MGKISTAFSMSLDGFVAHSNDDVGAVFGWMSRGDTDYTLTTGSGEIPLKISEKSVEMLEEAIQSAGALISGRKLFDITNGWGGNHPLHVPVVVVTHSVPQEWIDSHPEAPFTFVTDGIESAIEQAQKIAGDKKVAIASTTIAQQAIKLGLLDEIHIDLVPVIFGEGVRLFDQLGALEIELDTPQVIEAPGVTHLTYQVVKK